MLALSMFSPEFLDSLKLVSWETVYLVGTVVAGLFIGQNAYVIKQHKGKAPETWMMGLGSLMEGLWLLVSGLVLYYANFLPMINAIPTAYVLYSVFGWAYGFYLLQDQTDTIFDVEDIIMPDAYLNYSMAFAVVIVPTTIILMIGLWQMGYVIF